MSNEENEVPFQGLESRNRNVGPHLRICQLNIEGISKSKCEYLHSKVLYTNKIDVIVLQETHVDNEDDLLFRGFITGYDLVGATYHKHYGIATYVRNDIDNVSLIKISTDNDIEEVTIQVGQISVSNIYKPPQVRWPPEVLQPYPHPSIYISETLTATMSSGNTNKVMTMVKMW